MLVGDRVVVDGEVFQLPVLDDHVVEELLVDVVVEVVHRHLHGGRIAHVVFINLGGEVLLKRQRK